MALDLDRDLSLQVWIHRPPITGNLRTSRVVNEIDLYKLKYPTRAKHNLDFQKEIK